MDSSNKLTTDFIKGFENRQEVAKHINQVAALAGSSVRITAVHKDYRLLSGSEKARFNTQRNRESNKDPEKTMGLDYRIYSVYEPDKPDTPIIHIRFSDSGGYYIKIPNDRRQDPEAYLEEIASNTYILFVVKEMGKVQKLYSGITPLRKMLKLPHEMSTAPGNEGRMVFHYALSKVTYLPLTQAHGFFAKATLYQLEDLLYQ